MTDVSITRRRVRGSLAVAAAALAVTVTGCGSASIEVDRDTTFQTIEGWSATVEIGDSDFPQERVALYRDEIIEWVVDSMGINRLRLPIKSGYEHSEDRAPAFFADNARRLDWVSRWFEIENDNDDPFTADPDGFQFFWIDHLMETVVVPVRDRLAARGERLYLNLNYVDFGDSPFEHRDQPQEFAEFLLVVVQHLDSKYAIVADGIEILEPDNDADWTARDVANAFVAAGARLEAAGYRPDFIGPSNITVQGAITYLEEMMAVPGLDRYLKEFAYHKYGDVSAEDLREIARLAAVYGLRTSMLEHMFSTNVQLYDDLTLANVSVWQKFGILLYVQPDSAGNLGYRADGKLFSEYFRNIQRGAVRIGATSTRRAFSPVAFVNPDGLIVVIVRAKRRGGVTIGGLVGPAHKAHFVDDRDYDTSPITLIREDDGSWSATVPSSGLLVVLAGGA